MQRQRSAQRSCVFIIGAFLLGVLVTYTFVSKPVPSTTLPDTWHGSAGSSLRAQKMMLETTAKQNVVARKKLLAIVGVQTGFARPGSSSAYNYPMRREALRQTWFPASQEKADKVELSTSILYRFVIGHSLDKAQEESVDQEMKKGGACIRLPLIEDYMSLTRKTLVFLQYVHQRYDAKYIVKIDDDVYLRTDRLPVIINQWQLAGADYIGCMKTGQVFRDPHLRWFEPQNSLIGGKSYFTHAWGSVYVLSSHAASILATLSAAAPEGLRFFNNEGLQILNRGRSLPHKRNLRSLDMTDVTVGGWMLAMNVTHLDDRRLCESECGEATLIVYDIPQCAGLCDAPKKLPELHKDPACRTSVLNEAGVIPTLRPFFEFQSVRPS